MVIPACELWRADSVDLQCQRVHARVQQRGKDWSFARLRELQSVQCVAIHWGRQVSRQENDNGARTAIRDPP
jgi:hypothetical protein